MNRYVYFVKKGRNKPKKGALQPLLHFVSIIAGNDRNPVMTEVF